VIKKVPNNIIVGLLIIAFVVTLFSTLINVNQIFSGGNFGLITGAATNTTTGTSTLTVQSNTELSLQITTINFGSGYVNGTNASCTECVMDTAEGINSGNVSCCAGFNNITAGFLIENTGNENISVNFTCDGDCNATEFINGTSPLFQFRMTNSSDGATDGSAPNNTADTNTDTSASCSSGAGVGWNYSSWSDMPYSDAAFGLDLCGSNDTTEYYFAPNAAEDAAIMDIKVSIPEDAVTGSQKTATITFGATSSG